MNARFRGGFIQVLHRIPGFRRCLCLKNLRGTNNGELSAGFALTGEIKTKKKPSSTPNPSPIVAHFDEDRYTGTEAGSHADCHELMQFKTNTLNFRCSPYIARTFPICLRFGHEPFPIVQICFYPLTLQQILLLEKLFVDSLVDSGSLLLLQEHLLFQKFSKFIKNMCICSGLYKNNLSYQFSSRCYIYSSVFVQAFMHGL